MTLFELSGTVPGKARPRVTRNGTYLPERYRTWQTLAIAQLVQQKPLNWQPPQPAKVLIELCGKAHRSDLDNAGGSILDALVAAGVLENDGPKHVAQLSVAHNTTCKHPLALIEILSLQ